MAVPTDLNHDPDYLRRMLTWAIKPTWPRTTQEGSMRADLRDYFLYLTLDALRDRELTKTLIVTFADLEEWLENIGQEMADSDVDTTMAISYIAMLFALRQFLSLRHEIPLIPGTTVKREAFMQSWKRTAATLGLG